MLSKNKVKFITSLSKRKYRLKYNKFVAEGDKIVREVLEQSNIKIHSIYGLEDWIEANYDLIASSVPEWEVVNERELKQISTLVNPNQVLAVLEVPEVDSKMSFPGLHLVLDRIQDPGNLGTILRIADWFGIQTVICSPDCADHLQPKVIQASMGAFLRVPVQTHPILELFEANPEIIKYGLVLGGLNIFKTKLQTTGFIVVGNESQGLASELTDKLDVKLEIPAVKQGTESLNAAIATGIVCALFTGKN